MRAHQYLSGEHPASRLRVCAGGAIPWLASYFGGAGAAGGAAAGGAAAGTGAATAGAAAAGTAAAGTGAAAGTAAAAGSGLATAAGVATAASALYGATRLGKSPKLDATGVPSTDQASKNLSQLDRLRRRQGVLANLYGGKNQTAGPGVATKQLLGS